MVGPLADHAGANPGTPAPGGPPTPPAALPRADTPSTMAAGPQLAVNSAPGQTIDGFGASGAWWPTDLYHFSATAQHQLGRLLFSKAGLYLSQYRYNIGGGGVGVTVPYKAPPSFLEPNGQLNWDADPAGLDFLAMAAGYHVPTLIGFVNSAPPAFTTNGRSCGGSLNPFMIDAYARYLTEVVGHLYSVDHIRLSYLSPMNEPDGSQPSCRQEGMAVPLAERAAVFNSLASSLSTLPFHPLVIGDETSLVRRLLAELPYWLPEAQGSVAVVAHHAYDYPKPPVLEALGRLGVKHWATEICCWNGRGFGWQFDPTMASGLWLAHTIWADLVLARDSAFDWWTAVSPNMGCDPLLESGCAASVNPRGRNDGLIYIDPNWQADGNQQFYLTKRYWVMAAFSRYVRPGAILHDLTGSPPGVEAVAFQERPGWVVEVINSSSAALPSVDLSVPGAGGAVHAFVTDAAHDLSREPVGTYGGAYRLELPARSLTTVVLHRSLRTLR